MEYKWLNSDLIQRGFMISPHPMNDDEEGKCSRGIEFDQLIDIGSHSVGRRVLIGMDMP